MDPLTIRPAHPDDVPAIAAFQTAVWREAYAGLVPAGYLERVGVSEREHRWRDRLESGSRQVAIAGHAEVLGVVSWGRSEDDEPGLPELELKSLYVAAGVRGSGVGAALLRHAVGTAPALLWVFADNQRAVTFYRRHGFAADGRSAVDPDTGLDEVRLVRR